MRSDGQRTRQAARHFLCERGAGQGAAGDLVAQHFLHDLVRQQARAAFKAFTEPHQVADGPVFQLMQHRPQARHGAGGDQEAVFAAGMRDGGVEIGADAQLQRQWETGQIAVFAAGGHGGHGLAVAAPQQHVVAAGQGHGHGRAPGAGAKDGDLADGGNHIGSDFRRNLHATSTGRGDGRGAYKPHTSLVLT